MGNGMLRNTENNNPENVRAYLDLVMTRSCFRNIDRRALNRLMTGSTLSREEERIFFSDWKETESIDKEMYEIYHGILEESVRLLQEATPIPYWQNGTFF